MSEPPDALHSAIRLVRERSGLRPIAGLILGSGLGELANNVDTEETFSYSGIPGLRQPTVAGHLGRLLLGKLAGTPVAVLVGRSHYYEHGDMLGAVMPVRLLHALGCRYLVVTCAAGGLNPEIGPGDLMLINDQICLPALMGRGPLVGDQDDERFVDMGEAYNAELRSIASTVAGRLGIPIRQGVYVQVTGPQYETPAEQRLLRALGADAVGMSVAIEIIVARRLAMRALGVACITNVAAGGVSHADVLAVGRKAAEGMSALVHGVVAELK